jgi:type IV pilus assembly protein PilO
MIGLVGQVRAMSLAWQLALAVLCVVLIGAGGGVLLLASVRSRTAILEARRADLRREIAQAHGAVADLARHRLEGGELHRRLEEIAQKLPIERDIPPLYRRLHEAASSAGLAVGLFQPRDPRIQDRYTEIPLAMTVEGTYHQLAMFLERIAELPRVVTVGALKVTSLERPAASLRAELTLATYVYRPAAVAHPPGTSARGMALPPAVPHPASPALAGPLSLALSREASPGRPVYAPRGRRDPFAPASLPTPSPRDATAGQSPLIASAVLAGIVRGPDGPLALVELPDGLGYILRVGDGIEDARLIGIGSDSATFAISPAVGAAAKPITLSLGSMK